MSLKEYKRKRDFKKTAEPAGKQGDRSETGHQFVIQKHDASRLHYDFRLEHDGTLKSWAVPKGPHLDPAVKSLAVQVEDHPLDYADFEGIIPEGEYGGGTVMVWDRGTWEPEEDADRGFHDGKLKFTLHGEKLNGSWALVRMGGKAGDGGKNWLLIKHKDEAAQPNAKSDFLARHARSVVSGRKMEEIAADADRTWSSGKTTTRKTKVTKKTSRRKPSKRVAAVESDDISSLPRARPTKIPRSFKAQLATLASEVPVGDDWLHELKFDGYRILAKISSGKVRLLTRNGNDWTHRFPTVAAAVAALGIDHSILDGEIVSLDSNGRSDFQELQNFLKRGVDSSLVYYIFDAPYLGGYNLTDTPLVDRKQALSRSVAAANATNGGAVRYSDHIRGHGDDVLHEACNAKQEGIISKRADSHYQQSRSTAWLKNKCHQRQEFVIGGFTRPDGSRVGLGALLLGHYRNGDLLYAGRVGTGFTDESLRGLAAKLKQRERQSPAFVDPPKGAEGRGVRWVRPDLVGEVEFTEWTNDGHLRHPSFKGLRADKPAREVIREEPKMPAKKTSPSKRKAKSTKSNSGKSAAALDAIVAGVKITHPHRVVYADAGVTKLDLARYYEQVADWILPYVVGRPLTIVRCPAGQGGECFYQKHWTDSLPDAVHSVDVDGTEGVDKYVQVDDLAGLVALVQMGVLEFHPWPARQDNLERPDYLVFDLDPGEGVAWSAVVAGAKSMYDRLADVGLKSFLRTTGGKGLHVVVPLARRNTWEELKAYAKAVADATVRDDPQHFIATMSKAKRRGKIFVDYLRNQRGATAIASYSTRARAGGPVATPIAWDELSIRLKPERFNVRNLPKRLATLKSDPWKDFFRIKQSITVKMLNSWEP